MSLIHWWPLNGDLNDRGTSNVSLTNNGATVNNAGKIGSCYSFNNNNMVISTSDITSTTVLSLCLWLKLSTSHSGYAQVLVLGTSGTSWNNIRCGIDINGNGKVYFNTSTGSANTYIYSPSNYKDGAWHHIVGIYNNGSLQLYIDGSQVATGTTSNAPALSGTSIYVGGNAGGEKANNGDCINDVRIYDHALSVKELRDLAKGLILHYSFEDPNYTTIVCDNNGCQYNAAVTGTLNITRDPGCGSYCNQFGNNTRLEIDSPVAETRTLAVWIKCSATTTNQVIFSDYNSNLSLGFYNSSGANFIVAGTSAKKVFKIANYNTSSWNHVVVVRNSDDSIRACYVNGQALSQNGTQTNNYTQSNVKLLVGCRNNGSYNTYYSGKIADLKLFATEFTEADVLDLYKTRASIAKNGVLQTSEFIEDPSLTEFDFPAKTYTISAGQYEEGSSEVGLYNGEVTNLPVGYTPLAYIETTGAQYINTGIAASVNTGFSLLFQASDSTYSSNADLIVLGCRANSKRFWVDYDMSGSNRNLLFGYGNYYHVKDGLGGNTDIFTVQSNLTGQAPGICIAYQNGSSIGIYNASSDTITGNTQNMYLGCANDAGTAKFFSKVRIYSCKLYQSGSLVRDYVPVVYNNVAGFYDRVNNTFSASATSTAFVASSTSLKGNYTIKAKEIVEV